LNNIFDERFNGAAAIEMYRAWVFPDIYPEERQPVLKNWPKEDIDEFVGRY
jgi:hypothetical protein